VVDQSAIDIVLTDLKLPGTSGLELLRTLHEMHPAVGGDCVDAVRNDQFRNRSDEDRALDYVTKPFRIEELRARLEHAMHEVDLLQENRLLREQINQGLPGFGKLIGLSPKMQRVYKMIEKSRRTRASGAGLGESGQAKSSLREVCTYWAGEKTGRLCRWIGSSLVPTLIESELFGYVKGAFTGAVQSKQGLLEAANGGTLFLDEIGDMPTDLQARLLRSLQEREVKPVGSTERRRIDVRIVAATNRDLESAIRSGAFRRTSISIERLCKLNCRRCATGRRTYHCW